MKTSNNKYIALAQQHRRNHPGMLELAARCTCYSLLNLLSMWIASNWLKDTYTANTMVFTILIVVFELIRSVLYSKRDARFLCNKRLVWYIICLIGFCVAGLVLVHEATGFHRACHERPHVEKGML